jgi:hypothetical protein
MPDRTKSEAIFERFLSLHGIAFRRVLTGEQRTPDYEVAIGGIDLIFEVKETAYDPSFEREPSRQASRFRRRRTRGSPRCC